MIVTFPARFKTSRAMRWASGPITDIENVIKAYIASEGTSFDNHGAILKKSGLEIQVPSLACAKGDKLEDSWPVRRTPGKILTFEPVRVCTWPVPGSDARLHHRGGERCHLRAILMTRDDILAGDSSTYSGQHRRSERRRKDESARLAETGH
jgi:hypothetical protein